MNRAEKTEASQKRILHAAGSAFRKHGLSGVGVDGLAKAARFTSGAFYVHFRSKLDAFLAAIQDGLVDLNRAITDVQEKEGAGWVKAFVTFYLGFKRTCSLGDACTVPVLSSEVERAGKEARRQYEHRMKEIFETLANGLPTDEESTDIEKAYALMALLAGGALLSRTVLDPALSERIAQAVQKSALRMARRA